VFLERRRYHGHREALEERGAPTGGIVIGSGNSVTNYCKIENYGAMIDETREWNEAYG